MSQYMFPLLKSRQFVHGFQLHKLHFDHRIFDWKQSKIAVLNHSPTSSLMIPENLDCLLTTNNISIVHHNEMYLIKESNMLQVAPHHKTPFIFDTFATHCYMLTNEEHYDHLVCFMKNGKTLLTTK